MKFKVSLLFVGVLMLFGGCQHRYRYKYKNLEVWAVSSQTDESKIRPHIISSLPHGTIPEVMVMLNGKEIYLRQSLTKNKVLYFIKRTRISHEFASLNWEKLNNPDSMDKIYIELYIKNGSVQLLFSGQSFVKWSLRNGKNKGLKIASPKNKKYYFMPITVSQLKEIFGEPLESISGLSIK